MEDEEIICIALLKVKILDQLNPQDIRLIAHFFNLPEKGIYQQTLMELKKSIAYLILIERHDLQDYLELPKFQRLQTPLRHQISIYFRAVRDCFQNEKIAIQEENLRNLQKTQTGMEKLSNLMRNTIPKVNNSNQKTQMGFNRYNFFNQYNDNGSENRMNYSMPSMPSYIFPYQNYNNMFQDYTNRNNVMNDIMLDRSKQHEETIQITKKAELRFKNDNQNFKQEYFSESNIQSEEVQIQTASKYQCFCGKKKEDDTFKCKNCSKEFHSKCWTPISPEEVICPFCKIIYKHCYTKIVGEVIIERSEQVGQKLPSVKKINLGSLQIQQLNQAIKLCQNSENIWLQIRMLKIQYSTQSQPRGFKTSFPLAITEAKKLCNRKWLQIKLSNIGEGGYLLVSLVCVTPKQFSDLQKQIIEQKSQLDDQHSVKKKYSLAEISNMNINFKHPLQNRFIKIPVRGSRCEHVQCQDLKYIYQMGISRQPRILCSYCHKQYSVYEPFQYDSIIAQKLKQICQLQSTGVRMLVSSDNYQSHSVQRQSEKPKQSQNQMIDEKQEDEQQNLKDQPVQKIAQNVQNDQPEGKED